MPTFADEVVETSQTMGTGTYDLDSVLKSGYRLFHQAYASGAKPCFVVRNKSNTKWEINRLGTLTHGTPVRLSRAVVLSTNGNAAVPWTNDDLPLTIYVASSAEVLELVLNGNAGSSRNPMLQGFAVWPNTTAGAAGRVPFTINPTGSAEKEVGAWEGTKGLYVPQTPAPVRTVGAANSTIATTDHGWIVSHNTSAQVRTATLPAAATAGEGFPVGLYADGALPVVILTTGGEAIDDCVVPPGTLVWLRSTGSKWLVQSGPLSPSRRQTALMGSRDSNGFANILPASAAGLAITAQNVSAALPLVLSAAGGPLNRTGVKLAAPAWSGLTNSTTNYLYLVINADGTMTEGSTVLPPIYQQGGVPSTTNGQYTFNIGEMKGYLGNGSTAPQVWLVFVGEATASGGAVSAAAAYAYDGRYDSGYSGDLPATNTAVAKSHNLGVYPRSADFIIECTSTEGGYAVGDQIALGSIHNFDSSNIRLPTLSRDRKSMSVISSQWIVVNKSTAVGAVLTANKWKWRMVADRGW